MLSQMCDARSPSSSSHHVLGSHLILWFEDMIIMRTAKPSMISVTYAGVEGSHFSFLSSAQRLFSDGGVVQIMRTVLQSSCKNCAGNYCWIRITRKAATVYSASGMHGFYRNNFAVCLRSFFAKVWNTTTGDELLTLDGHRNVVYAIAFNNPWGSKIITGSFDKTCKLWNAEVRLSR